MTTTPDEGFVASVLQVAGKSKPARRKNRNLASIDISPRALAERTKVVTWEFGDDRLIEALQSQSPILSTSARQRTRIHEIVGIPRGKNNRTPHGFVGHVRMFALAILKEIQLRRAVKQAAEIAMSAPPLSVALPVPSSSSLALSASSDDDDGDGNTGNTGNDAEEEEDECDDDDTKVKTPVLHKTEEQADTQTPAVGDTSVATSMVKRTDVDDGDNDDDDGTDDEVSEKSSMTSHEDEESDVPPRTLVLPTLELPRGKGADCGLLTDEREGDAAVKPAGGSGGVSAESSTKSRKRKSVMSDSNGGIVLPSTKRMSMAASALCMARLEFETKVRVYEDACDKIRLKFSTLVEKKKKAEGRYRKVKEKQRKLGDTLLQLNGEIESVQLELLRCQLLASESMRSMANVMDAIPVTVS